LRRIGNRAGLDGKRLGPHVFRHTYALDYLRFPGNDVYKLSHLLGHTSLAVTSNYLREYTARDAARGPSVLDNLGR
jgi:integrase/recombinase XerD